MQLAFCLREEQTSSDEVSAQEGGRREGGRMGREGGREMRQCVGTRVSTQKFLTHALQVWECDERSAGYINKSGGCFCCS